MDMFTSYGHIKKPNNRIKCDFGIKKCFVIKDFRSERFRNKQNVNTCNTMGNDPFQINTSLYPEIRSKRARYREARLYFKKTLLSSQEKKT